MSYDYGRNDVHGDDHIDDRSGDGEEDEVVGEVLLEEVDEEEENGGEDYDGFEDDRSLEEDDIFRDTPALVRRTKQQEQQQHNLQGVSTSSSTVTGSSGRSVRLEEGNRNSQRNAVVFNGTGEVDSWDPVASTAAGDDVSPSGGGLLNDAVARRRSSNFRRGRGSSGFQTSDADDAEGGFDASWANSTWANSREFMSYSTFSSEMEQRRGSSASSYSSSGGRRRSSLLRAASTPAVTEKQRRASSSLRDSARSSASGTDASRRGSNDSQRFSGDDESVGRKADGHLSSSGSLAEIGDARNADSRNGSMTSMGSNQSSGRGKGLIRLHGKSFRRTQSLREDASQETDDVPPLPVRSKTVAVGGRPSTMRRGTIYSPSVISKFHGDTESAVANLESASTEWEGVAAAAAVVAGSSDAVSKKRHCRYGVGDKVLVYLNVLNSTAKDQNGPDEENQDGLHWTERLAGTTRCPVNKYGFPQSYNGKLTPEEQGGPWLYVLTTVKNVHFEEDARYYTVCRADNGAEQRADTEWMEPILTARGAEAAFRAAQQHRTDSGRNEKVLAPKKRAYNGVSGICVWFSAVIGMRCVTCFRASRRVTKKHATNFLYGNPPFACEIHVTMVNVLVLCSFIFMFIDQARLAFFPASADWAITIVSTIVWMILAIELMFEVLIRPDGYSALIVSEKAYAPSTARFINSFHLVCEVSALALFLPELRCLASKDCGQALSFSLLDASLKAVLGPTRSDAFVGQLCFLLTRIRVFGLVRHWKQMWINNTFVERTKKPGIFHALLPGTSPEDKELALPFSKKKTSKKEISMRDSTRNLDVPVEKKEAPAEEDNRLNEAATIGTALMVVNSHRAMILLVAVFGFLPLIYTIQENGGTNMSAQNMVQLLQQNNLAMKNNNTGSCAFLQETIQAWLRGTFVVQASSPAERESDVYVLWAQVLPVRCDFQRSDGLITFCPTNDEDFIRSTWGSVCDVWGEGTIDSTPDQFAEAENLRAGVITIHSFHEGVMEGGKEEMYNVTAMFNDDHSVSLVNFSSVEVQASLLLLILLGLSVLRGDAGRLVLFPLRRMLKIVLLYAKNPLSSTPATRRKTNHLGTDRSRDREGNNSDSSDSDFDGNKDQLGNYETEQLINAIAKITDLLRKCWGVAGAGIISSNLARTQEGITVFNPLLPGKLVYALFGFAAINEFSKQLRALEKDVMILINDVAKVVHEEVFRWGLGNSGQCNKNLGSAFLMVFRIGDFKEVQEKKNRATDVIFSSVEKRSTKKSSVGLKRRRQINSIGKTKMMNTRRNILRKRGSDSGLAMDTLQLASLPGISAFTDRAVIGMLKSFAGIHRDQKLIEWKKDFRLGAGVGAFSVDMIFGMDAGWAVEGAVGSEYKIDATYLSPHVNMASRMMSACKQYGVTILLSQAVEELLSSPARSKLRHIDTVTVKGSSLKQRIFTYDARYQGVDFFLFQRSEEQADLESDRYTANIWNTDQDLIAMRQHVTKEFEELFDQGRRQYLAGNWQVAIELLKEADEMMVSSVIEQGFIEYDTEGMEERLLHNPDMNDEEVIRLRNEFGDGPARCLLSHMEKFGGVAPQNWAGVRPLTSK